MHYRPKSFTWAVPCEITIRIKTAEEGINSQKTILIRYVLEKIGIRWYNMIVKRKRKGRII